MQIHQVQPKTKNRKGRRIGRGGKKGTYSGRGMKGQKSRAGTHFQPRIRELIKKYPKLRGYRAGATPNDIIAVNLDVIEKHFGASEKITPAALVEKRIIAKMKGRVPKVKVLGRGEISKKLSFEGCQVSQSAKEKIEKAGGTVAV